MSTRTLAIVGVVALVAGCDIITESCTLIGCVDGVDVTVAGREANVAYTLEIVSGTESRTFECPAASATCAGRLDAAPTEITVRVRWRDQVVQRTIRPEYIRSRPNGANCEPECKQASVTVDPRA